MVSKTYKYGKLLIMNSTKRMHQNMFFCNRNSLLLSFGGLHLYFQKLCQSPTSLLWLFLCFAYRYILHKAKTAHGVDPELMVHYCTHLCWFITRWTVTAIEVQLLQKGIERIPKNFEGLKRSIKVEYCYYENDNPSVFCLILESVNSNLNSRELKIPF